DEAVKVGRQLDEFCIAWLEEPVMADDFDGYHTIADAIETPVVGGENHFTHRDLKPFFASGKIPILQPDIMRGGYTEMRVIAEHAHRAGMRIAPHLFPELSSHLMASIDNPSWLEDMGWYHHLWVEPCVAVDGMMAPPSRPGHGMDFKPELLRDYPYRGAGC
ncbi:MAG: hypothetical protein HOI95_02835, partial [Chromatiales bacterium]|nr:hypothetical protein [Chromatiales bacterium]